MVYKKRLFRRFLVKFKVAFAVRRDSDFEVKW